MFGLVQGKPPEGWDGIGWWCGAPPAVWVIGGAPVIRFAVGGGYMAASRGLEDERSAHQAALSGCSVAAQSFR